MDDLYQFYTPTSLPIEAFTVMGMSAKPMTTNPIGEFGTGLKLAVATVLRLGGTFELLIDGVEYQFYAKTRDFRGTDHKQVMMRKRKGLLSRFTYHELPFTLNYGRNLSGWQVIRELESNTRDEQGSSKWFDADDMPLPETGTYIHVKFPGIREAIEEGEIFLDTHGLDIVWSSDFFNVYDRPSQHVYYRGIRVQSLDYPSRYTYDFKPGKVQLTEDRSPANLWQLFHRIQHGWMTENIEKSVLYKALSFKEDRDEPRFETHKLTFDATTYGITPNFISVARELKKKGFAAPKTVALTGSWAGIAKARTNIEVKFTLTQDDANKVIKALVAAKEVALSIRLQKLLDKARDEASSMDDMPF